MPSVDGSRGVAELLIGDGIPSIESNLTLQQAPIDLVIKGQMYTNNEMNLSLPDPGDPLTAWAVGRLWFRVGNLTIFEDGPDGGPSGAHIVISGEAVPVQIHLTDNWTLKVSYVPSDPNTGTPGSVKAKVWATNASEPGWQIDTTDDNFFRFGSFKFTFTELHGFAYIDSYTLTGPGVCP